MPSAIFCVPIVNNNPQLPPFGDPGDGSLWLSDTTEGYGWAAVGNIPSTVTCLVRVWNDQARLDAMATSGEYLLIEAVD